MRAVFVLFDSLNCKFLPPYGSSGVHGPNFERLAARTMTFDQHYVGSLPCMPARRDIHTGRLNFIHRSWGPLEPFDVSFAEILKSTGVYSHITTDHHHYFEDGGATYHNRYDSWEFFRGQEWDNWQGIVNPNIERYKAEYHPKQVDEPGRGRRYINYINREAVAADSGTPTEKTFDAGLKFIDRNHGDTNWFLQIETFDPHEPFQVPDRFQNLYPPSGYEGPTLDWPTYSKQAYGELELAELNRNYAMAISYCDEQLGRLLDKFDALDLWADTALIISTDHGFLLGEHQWTGKSRMPMFNEIAKIPLFVHDPKAPEHGGSRCTRLTQATDLMPSILDIFGAEAPSASLGKSIFPLGNSGPGHEAILYGLFGGAINITDGRYTYFRYPRGENNLFEYTLMPMHQASLFKANELKHSILDKGFSFTQEMPVLKIPGLDTAARPPVQGGGFADTETCLYDLEQDSAQKCPIDNPDVEAQMIHMMREILILNEAPDEVYARFNLGDPVR